LLNERSGQWLALASTLNVNNLQENLKGVSGVKEAVRGEDMAWLSSVLIRNGVLQEKNRGDEVDLLMLRLKEIKGKNFGSHCEEAEVKSTV
jgi:hypothetical protein